MGNAMELGLQMVKVAAGLAVVIGLMVVAVYGLKRLGGWVKRPETGSWIQVMAQHPVGLKHNLVLVRVQEQLFLLGVSPQGIHFLSPIQKDAAGSSPAETVPK